jgi:hypothetical protein
LLARVISFPTGKQERIPNSSSPTENASRDQMLVLSETKRKEKVIAEMTIGDRVALLLHLRRISFGDVAQLETRCPACQEPMASDLAISELVRQPQVQPETDYYNIEFDEYSIWARLPCGKDQNLIAQAGSHPDGPINSEIDYARQIVRMCVTRSIPDLPRELPVGLVQKISAKLEVLDPLANIKLNMTCPACNRSFKMPFFVEQFLLLELMMHQRRLEQEIHWLAFYYHWNENEILSLPITRRKRYVELIADDLSTASSLEGT